MTLPVSPPPSCARCGGELPATLAGVPKSTTRYCCRDCRVSDVRDRRAAARERLCKAVAELQEALQVVRLALLALGLPRPEGGNLAGSPGEHAKEVRP